MSKRILLVDDDPNFCNLIITLLSQFDHNVVQAATAEDAMLKIKSNPDFQLMIIDGLLPDTTGIDLIHKLRIEEKLDTKIIFISAFWRDLSTFKKLTSHYNVSSVLSKPISPKEFKLHIKSILLSDSILTLPGKADSTISPENEIYKSEEDEDNTNKDSISPELIQNIVAVDENENLQLEEDDIENENLITNKHGFNNTNEENQIGKDPSQRTFVDDSDEFFNDISEQLDSVELDKKQTRKVNKNTEPVLDLDDDEEQNTKSLFIDDKSRENASKIDLNEEDDDENEDEEEDDDDIEAELEEVKRLYAKILVNQLKQLEELLYVALKTAKPEVHLKKARMLAHKIYGASGSYGFSKISSHIAEVENVIMNMIDNNLNYTTFTHKELILTITKAYYLSELSDEDKEHDNKTLEIGTLLIVADQDEKILSIIPELKQRYLYPIVYKQTSKDAIEYVKEHFVLGAILKIDTKQYKKSYDLARDLQFKDLFGQLPISFICDEPSLDDRIASSHAGVHLFMTTHFNSQQLDSMIKYFIYMRDSKQPKILILDESKQFVNYIKLTFEEEGILVEHSIDSKNLLDVLDSFQPDLIMLDTNLSGVTGFDICRLIRTSPEWKNVPIMFLTGNVKDEIKMACFESGADDYLNKNAEKWEVVARAKVHLDRSRLQKEHYYKDPLTKLYSRTVFIDLFQQQLDEAKRKNNLLALVIMGIDNLKMIIDIHGYSLANRVISQFGQVIASQFRSYDVSTRWSRDKFVVVFKGEDEDIAEKIMERFSGAIKRTKFLDRDNEPVNVTFNFGISVFPEEGTTLQELLQIADYRLNDIRQRSAK